MLLDRNQLLLRDEAVPATERLGVFGGIRVIGSHAAAHKRRGGATDAPAGLKGVLRTHARAGCGPGAGPGVGGCKERFGRLKLADIGRRSHDGLVAEPTWLVVHARNPFGGDKSAALVFATRSI